MKLQIINPVTAFTILFLFITSASQASKEEIKKTKTEQTGIKLIDQNGHQPASNHGGQSKNNRPFKQHHKDGEKDHHGPKDATHRRSHSEEDGKHHHFHMHRARKAKKHAGLVCFLAKILLVITHICLLVYVYEATMAH
jgi:hypothetical protein